MADDDRDERLEQFRNIELRRGSDSEITRPGVEREEIWRRQVDVDGVVEEVEEPRFKSHAELAEARQQLREDQAEEAKETARQETAQRERDHTGEVTAQREWTDDTEVAAAESLVGDYQKIAGEKKQLEQVTREMTERAKFAASQGDTAFAEQMVGLLRQAHAVQNSREAEFAQRYQLAETMDAEKQRRGDMLVLHHLAPGLKDRDEQERLTKWLEKNNAIARAEIESSRDPTKIAQAYRAMLREDEQGRVGRARKVVASNRLASRGSGSQTTSKDARASLARTGNLDDALNFLNLRREEKRQRV